MTDPENASSRRRLRAVRRRRREEARISSGSLLVLALVVAATVLAALTWWKYHAENPTSVDGSLVRGPLGWSATARFESKDTQFLVPGTGVILTSPSFPGVKMSGSIANVDANAVVTVDLQTGPPDDATLTRAPCRVTVDSATTPVHEEPR